MMIYSLHMWCIFIINTNLHYEIFTRLRRRLGLSKTYRNISRLRREFLLHFTSQQILRFQSLRRRVSKALAARLSGYIITTRFDEIILVPRRAVKASIWHLSSEFSKVAKILDAKNNKIWKIIKKCNLNIKSI